MSDRRRLDIDAIRESHEPFDNGCCSKCGVEDCDVAMLLAEVERLGGVVRAAWDRENRLQAAVQAVRDLPLEAVGNTSFKSGWNYALRRVRKALDVALGGEQ